MIPVMKLNAKIYDPRVLQYEFDIINDAIQGNCKHSSLQCSEGNTGDIGRVKRSHCAIEHECEEITTVVFTFQVIAPLQNAGEFYEESDMSTHRP